MAQPGGNAEPEIKLSRMIKRDLDVDISPNTLRLFLKANWREVQALAHDIRGLRATDNLAAKSD